MSLVIGLLTFVLVLNSLLLILLILVQLPKKDAGAGLAFGGATSDALFGAGSGTVLSRVTKYAAGIFLILALTLSVLHSHRVKAGGRGILSELDRQAKNPAAAMANPAVTPTNQGVVLQPAVTNLVLPVLPVTPTNPPAR
jgi:preprotein translocase subunit SecG